MSKPRSKAADFAVYLVVRVVVCFVQALSFRAACQVAVALAWLAYHLDRRHRLVALDNLRHAFGQGDAAERDRLVRAIYRHFCTVLMEIIHLPRKLHPQNWKQHVELLNYRPILDLLLTDRPVLVVSGHFGNWELGGYVFALLGFRTHAIARPLDNPYVDAFLRRFRESTGQKVLNKDGDFDKIEQVLASRGILLTLGDQDAGQKGQFVDFFGRPASTHKAVALLALEYNVPMIVLTGTRAPLSAAPGSDNWRYQGEVADIIYPEEYVDRPDAVSALTQRFTTALEQMIRRYPEQYFWLHRRWKHQPKRRAKDKQVA
jgi:Kdo2-lipid IVA lauroyltransferase/acyltransferase